MSRIELNALKMSDGFRQATKSRQTIPSALLSASEGDDDDHLAEDNDDETSGNESPSKRKSALRRTNSSKSAASSSQKQLRGSPLKRSFSSLALNPSASRKNTSTAGRATRQRRTSQGDDDGGEPEAPTPTATPTKPKQSQAILFVSGDARPKATPRRAAGQKSAANTSLSANGAASGGRGRNKEKEDGEEGLETPTRQRTRHVAPNGSSVKGGRNSEYKQNRSIAANDTEDDDHPQASGSRARAIQRPQKKAVTLQLGEDEEEEVREGADDVDEEEEAIDGATDDENQSTASSEDPISGLAKRSPSKQKAKAASQSVLEVPGFITQTSFDVYFQQTSIPARTSTRMFTSELPTLSTQEYWDRLAASSSSSGTKHEAELKRLRESHVKFFPRYMMELQAGFNILFYGFGSKRETLSQFARHCCAKKGDVVVFNGYRPGVSVKELLNQIDTLRGDDTAASITTSLSTIEIQAQRIYSHYLPPASPNSDTPAATRPLFIIIHNIESTGLRNQKSKAILALLASNPRIHLIGSVDHMNAPLIWRQSEATGRGHDAPPPAESGHDDTTTAERAFTWLWHDLTTFEHYDVELRASGKDLTSLTVLGSGKPKVNAAVSGALGGPAATAGPLTEAGAHQVLSSVTERSRKIFFLLAKRQLADIDAEAVVATDSPTKKANVTGPQMSRHALSYESLFSLARESFIATSDQALRGLLQEFKDHGMVMMGASNTAGGEMIWIPVARNVLEKLVDSMSDEHA
ncbi:Origin recognition complex subunit 2 [Tulasnella sp. JGI-2019a]|nr:Origin recognition complex subunit 2 [Tulasnella sp. JGI-2019a]